MHQSLFFSGCLKKERSEQFQQQLVLFIFYYLNQLQERNIWADATQLIDPSNSDSWLNLSLLNPSKIIDPNRLVKPVNSNGSHVPSEPSESIKLWEFGHA